MVICLYSNFLYFTNRFFTKLIDKIKLSNIIRDEYVTKCKEENREWIKR